MANRSVTRLQALFALLPQEIKAPVLAETQNQAEELKRAMQAAVPVGATATLRDSIRTERGRRLRVLVRAGGPTTTRGGYDYANATEFGTQHVSAQPFFWPTYRRNRARMRRAMKAAAILAIRTNWRDDAAAG